MLRFAVIAAVGALSAVAAAKALTNSAPPAAAQEAPLRGPQPGDSDAAMITKAADGHYWAEGMVAGRRVRFLVDTGASTVALTTADAQRLGLDPTALVYDQPLHTANGDGLAARVHLASVSVGGATVNDVDALVVGRGLSSSLLGMTFLGRLSRFEATPNALILRP